jgi:hypothetical protein
VRTFSNVIFSFIHSCIGNEYFSNHIRRKKGSKKSDILKIFFLGNTEKRMVFILEKVKLGVGVYFSGAIQIWDVWDMVEKNTQSLCPKFRFSPIAP